MRESRDDVGLSCTHCLLLYERSKDQGVVFEGRER